MNPARLLLACSAALTCACAADDAGPRPLTCDVPIVTTAYRVDAIDMPTTPGDGEALGRDLDGDDTVDNQLANVLSAVFSITPALDAEATYHTQLDERVAGGLDWQLERSTCPTSGESRAALRDGQVPLGALTDLLGGAEEGWHPAQVEAVEVETSDGALDARIAIGLAPGYVEVIARSVTPYANHLIAIGDHDYGFDPDGDGVATEAEVLAAEIFVTLLTPDLDTDGDGVEDSFSLGLGVHATEIASAP